MCAYGMMTDNTELYLVSRAMDGGGILLLTVLFIIILYYIEDFIIYNYIYNFDALYLGSSFKKAFA